jgi:3-oxoacyl-[acyl-carrier-protein] synthase-3
MSIKIVSTGMAVPENAVTNDRLSEFMDTSDEWISTRTGIHSRYIASAEDLTELCLRASGKALDRAGIKPSEVDLVICSTISGDYMFPSLACCLSERLGLSCPAFDINAACSGFIYALDVADGYISAGKAKNILLVCGEMMSRLVDWTDRSTCVLFGDGAAAVVVTSGSAMKYLHLTASGNTKMLHMRVGNGNSPFRPKQESGFLCMQGQEVFKFAVSMVEQETSLALNTLGMKPEDIDIYLMHQANKRIIDTARNRLGQPEEKFPVNIGNYGNISSASIPLLLDEMLTSGKILPGSRLLLMAFGAGMTTGTCVMIWE